MSGKVYLVGSGPGGEGLLTQRAKRVIDTADVVLFDQLPVRRSLHRSPPAPKRLTAGNTGGSTPWSRTR